MHHSQHPAEFVIVDLPALMGSDPNATRGRVRTLKAVAKQKTSSRISREGLLECEASSHRFLDLHTVRSERQNALNEHVGQLLKCRRCPRMQSTPVSGGAIVSEVMLIGQAPGPREPVLLRPFAHTAGKTLFRWFEKSCGMNEATVRSQIYFAAVCRCFPGKNSSGGDRVPAPDEIRNCSSWMDEEIAILQPRLIIPVGRLAIMQFVDCEKLERVIGRKFRLERAGPSFDVIPLPHPSGASPWHKVSPGKELLEKALRKIARHAAIQALIEELNRKDKKLL